MFQIWRRSRRYAALGNRTEPQNKRMHLTVGALVKGTAPPAGDARCWADVPGGHADERG
jgi:hypothetical protein